MRDATMSMCAYLKLSVKYNGLTGTAPPGVGSTHLAQVIHSTDLTELPETLTTLGTRAFFSCRSLLLTALPPTVTAIGNGAFEHCTSLALTALPPNPTSIGDGTFRGCTSLLLTELPPILTTIGDSAFLGCTPLRERRRHFTTVATSRTSPLHARLRHLANAIATWRTPSPLDHPTPTVAT